MSAFGSLITWFRRSRSRVLDELARFPSIESGCASPTLVLDKLPLLGANWPEVFYIPAREEFIICSGGNEHYRGYCINHRYSLKGQLLAISHAQPAVHPSGAEFTEEGYYDWAVSADDSLKLYAKDIDLDAIGLDAFNVLVASARYACESVQYDASIVFYYLLIDGDWQRFRSAQQFKLWQEGGIDPPALIDENKFIAFVEKVQPSWLKEESGLSVESFRKLGSTGTSLVGSFNPASMGSSNADIGCACISFGCEKDGQQPLHFRMTAKRSRESYNRGEFDFGVAVYSRPESAHTRFLFLRPMSSYRSFQEQGLYRVTSARVDFKESPKFYYGLKAEGIQPDLLEWSEIEFFTHPTETIENQGLEVDAAERALPSVLNLGWQHSECDKSCDFLIQLGEQIYQARDSSFVRIKILLNWEEMQAVFDDGADLGESTFVLKSEQRGNMARMSLWLERAGQRQQIRKLSAPSISVRTCDPGDDDFERFQQRFLAT